tara:strand:- start:230 stop:457 length:228 start_codon:yes stop_codon:yes gene_type:complete
MDDIIKELDEIGTELFRKFGTCSYELRCKLYDVRDKLKNNTEPVSRAKCSHLWKTIGHQLNGHQECSKCGLQKEF